RLQCFDRLAVDLGIETQEDKLKKEVNIGQIGAWRETEKMDESGNHILSLHLKSNAPYKTPSGMQRQPELVFSCKPQYTEIYIDWKAPLTSPTSSEKTLKVVYNFDDDVGIKANWDLSLD